MNNEYSRLWYTKDNTNKPNQNIINVLDHAFPIFNYINEDNAYTLLTKYQGHGMDWWCFPWDIKSSKNQYTLKWTDMKYLLENIMVSSDGNLYSNYIRYSDMVCRYVNKLTYSIMNAHGGAARVVKIIYFVRNLLKIAIDNNLINDIKNLKESANHILKISYTNNLLLTGYSREGYIVDKGKKMKEIRNGKNGIRDLKIMLG